MNGGKFFRNALILMALAVGILAMFGRPVLNLTGYGYSQDVVRYADTLVPMNAERMQTLLNGAGNRPTMMFIYASWCPYCKRQFGALNALQKRYGSDKINFVYVSIDKTPYDLSKFLLESHPDHDFTPFYVARSDVADFFAALTNAGFQPKGSIPYMVFFDKEQKPVHELVGSQNVGAMVSVLLPLL